MKKFFGKVIKGFTKGLDVVLKFITALIETLVNLISDIRAVIASVIGMVGCVMIFIFPYILIPLLMNPIFIILIIVFVIFPLLGTKFVNWLKYINFTSVEFLKDYADYLINDDKHTFSSFKDYSEKYRTMQEEKAQREREERRKAEEEMWEERFKQWFGDGNFYGGTWTNQGGNYYGGYQGNYQGQSQGYSNPVDDFVTKYKKSCDILEVDYSADKYAVKLAYRKMAKKYHPDINKSADATEKFQEINTAYDFLSDENIERYNRINNKQ